jgi:hypothetical protein
MKNTLTVGPIKKAEKTNGVYAAIRKQMNDMKVGEYFEVSGVSKKEATIVRGAISYYSKRDKCVVSTRLAGTKLKIERVRAAKSSQVKETSK